MKEIKLDVTALWPGREEGPYEYALLVDQVEAGRFFCESYGLRVRAKGTGEESRVEHITLSARRIDELCELVAGHQVGPTHLRDVVEDWL